LDGCLDRPEMAESVNPESFHTAAIGLNFSSGREQRQWPSKRHLIQILD
jgi:hypothetical protein